MRIEGALLAALDRVGGPTCPPRLSEAVHYAVFPQGSRIRPRLCLAVASACGERHHQIAEGAAAAIEFLHCASLVHDDLPCFDDAMTRRGRPSVHAAYGEPLAVLAGDALIVLAFETIAREAAAEPRFLSPLLIAIAQATGMPSGIVAGQAWECEPQVELSRYHRAKTGSLFVAAAVTGAIAAGVDPSPWRTFGERLGEAYQVADDIRDFAVDPERLGKPGHRDRDLGRPSAALQLGLADAIHRLELLVAGAVGSIPKCRGASELRALVAAESERLLPKELALQAA